MTQPFFSIIIPTLNEERYLPLLLKDLMRQRNKNFEVVVADGYSDDTTVAKCKTFLNSLRIHVYTSDKRNVAYQKNLGATKAHGQYLIFLDADVRINPSFTAKLQQVAQKYHRLILVPRVMPQEKSQIDQTLFEFGNYFLEMSQIVGKPLPSIGCLIIEKNFFNHIGGFDAKIIERSGIAEDHDIMLRGRKAGVIGKYIPSVLIKFSLRRIKKEGRISMIQKYLTAALILTRKGRLESKIFEYEMGGQYYQKTTTRAKTFSVAKFKRLMRQFEKAFTS